MQRKHFTAPIEIKSLDEGGSFEGYASVFGVQDSDGDVIVKGAFTNTIKAFQQRGKMPKMLWQHNPSQIIGKYSEVQEDDNGLWVKGSLILDVQQGREAYALMKAGELDAMSVGFNIVNAGGDGSMRGRVIEEVDLWEISLVTWGANPEALVTNVKRKRDFEALLRDAGLSRKQSLAFVAGGYNAALGQSDSDEDDGLIDAVKSLKAKLEELSHG